MVVAHEVFVKTTEAFLLNQNISCYLEFFTTFDENCETYIFISMVTTILGLDTLSKMYNSYQIFLL